MRRFLPLLAIPLLILGMAHSTHAQVTPGPANQAGLLYASNFSSWTVPQGNVGPYSWSNPQQCTVTSGGISFKAFTVGTPVTLVDTVNSAHTEVVTPTAVNVSGAGCSITINPIYSHNSFFFTTSTGGLQEAINWAGQQLYSVILTPDWTRAGGVTADIAEATGNTNVSILDQRNSCLIAYAWSGSEYAEQANFCTGGGSGVTNINGATGAIIFTGSGVSQSGNTFAFNGGQSLTLQTNGTNNTNQSLLNFLNTTNCAWTNPSGGEEQVNCGINGSFQNYVPDPLGTQSVVIYPTSFTINQATGGATAVGDDTSAQLTCLNDCSPGPLVTWSGFELPSGLTAAQVTAVYVASTNSLTPQDANGVAFGGVDCGTHDLRPTGSTPFGWPMQAFILAAPDFDPSQISTWTCTAGLNATQANNSVLNVASIGIRLYYTGTPLPSTTILNLTVPLYRNPTLNTMGVGAIDLSHAGDGGVTGLLPNANLANPAMTINGTTCTLGSSCTPSGGGGTTTNPLTAAATGGAAPGTTFNGSAAVTFDYHSFGAAGISGTPVIGNCADWATSTTLGDTGSPCGSGGSGTGFNGGLGSSYQDATEIAAPASPAAGNDRLYLDSTTHQLSCLTSSGSSCMPSGGGSAPSGTGVPQVTSGAWATTVDMGTTANVPLVSNGADGAQLANGTISTGGSGATQLLWNTTTVAGLSTLSPSPVINQSVAVVTDATACVSNPTGGGSLIETLIYAGSGNWSEISCSGSAGGSGGLFSPALQTPTITSTGFSTALNQSGTFTATNSPTGITLADSVNQTGTNLVEGIVKAYPSTPFTATYLFSVPIAQNSSNRVGVVITTTTLSSSPAITWYLTAGALDAFGVTNLTGSSSFTTLKTLSFTANPAYLWMRYTDDGTTISLSYSFDGSYYAPFYSVAKASSYLGASGFGFLGAYLATSGGTGGAGATLLSYGQQ